MYIIVHVWQYPQLRLRNHQLRPHYTKSEQGHLLKKKKWENGEEKKENWKREGGKLKTEGGKFAFDFSKNKQTNKQNENYFGSTKMGIFYQVKAFHAWPGKMTSPPPKNIPLTPLITIDEYNKSLDRQRPCFEDELTEWSNLQFKVTIIIVVHSRGGGT